MIEAWQIEHRPWAYFFLRRFELIRWTLTTKLHSEAKWYALPLSLWLAIIGHETERCCFCGWKVEVVWWCEDEIAWTTVTGYKDGGGISCVKCFDSRASTRKLSLRWLATPLCGYTDEEWQRIIQENAETLAKSPYSRTSQTMIN